MKKYPSKAKIAALISSALLMVACGAKPQRQTAAADGRLSGGGIINSDPVGGGDTTGTGTGTGTSTTNTNPPIAFSYNLAGIGTTGTLPSKWVSAEVQTDNLLKVKVSPGAAGGLNLPPINGVSYGYVANYGCISYDVKVLDQTITTQTLSVNGGSFACPNAPTSQVLDFSSRLTPGHGPIKVEVSNARYDFYCQSCYTFPWFFNAYQYGCNMYCPLRPLFKNHTAAGTLKIQVNGTYLD